MTEQKGIKETLEVVKAVELLGVEAKKVFEDGKINGDDIPSAIELVKNAQVFIDAVEGIAEVDDEAKDLSEAELLELGTKFYSAVKNIKAAKRA